jgi:hypothetical protein
MSVLFEIMAKIIVLRELRWLRSRIQLCYNRDIRSERKMNIRLVSDWRDPERSELREGHSI